MKTQDCMNFNELLTLELQMHEHDHWKRSNGTYSNKHDE